MKNPILHVGQAYFGSELDLRIRLFNVLVIISACFCTVIAVVNAFVGIGLVGVLVDLAAAAFCISLLIYARHSRRARICHMIFIVVSFFILFPYLFFRMGGYHGGITVFLVFAVVFTVFMLEGKTALIVTLLELALYAGLYIYAYSNPESVTMFSNERGFFISNLMDLLIVGISLGATMYAQVKLYRAQQKKLYEQNAVLEQANRLKTEFLANTSHEMRTPLTVTSVNVQTVMEILEDMGDAITDPDVNKLLQSAQNEIMRLSRMVGGMLTLNSMSENTDREQLDLTALLQSSVEMLRLSLDKHGNTVETDIEAELCVFGNADLLAQVMTNILQNASNHTENGRVTVTARRQGNEILVIVQDTGIGIAPELLPHVFERGISTGGTGVGLFLCNTVVETHGGRIWIESEPQKGTAVFYTLPYYEGQFGGGKQ